MIPAGFLTAVPNWKIGEVFLIAHGRKSGIRSARAWAEPRRSAVIPLLSAEPLPTP